MLKRFHRRGAAGALITSILIANPVFSQPAASADKDAFSEVTQRRTAFIKTTTEANCPYAPEAVTGSGTSRPFLPQAAVVAAATVVAKAAYSGIKDLLKELEDDKTATYIASGPVDLVDKSCISIVRGEVTTEDLSLDTTKYGGIDVGRFNKTLGLAAGPDFLLQLNIAEADKLQVSSKAKDGTTVTEELSQFVIKPRYFLFGKSASKRAANNEKEIGLVLVLRATPSSATTKEDLEKDATFVVPFDLGKVKPKTFLATYDMFPGEEVTLRVKSGTKLNGYAVVTESDDASKVLKLISSAYSDSGDEIKAALVEALKDALGGDKE